MGDPFRTQIVDALRECLNVHAPQMTESQIESCFLSILQTPAVAAIYRLADDPFEDGSPRPPQPEDMKKALAVIAFSSEVGAFSGNPSKWPSTIAYKALGGRIVDGHRVDDLEDLF